MYYARPHSSSRHYFRTKILSDFGTIWEVITTLTNFKRREIKPILVCRPGRLVVLSNSSESRKKILVPRFHSVVIIVQRLEQLDLEEPSA